jgi:hypothetical protein
MRRPDPRALLHSKSSITRIASRPPVRGLTCRCALPVSGPIIPPAREGRGSSSLWNSGAYAVPLEAETKHLLLSQCSSPWRSPTRTRLLTQHAATRNMHHDAASSGREGPPGQARRARRHTELVGGTRSKVTIFPDRPSLDRRGRSRISIVCRMNIDGTAR